MERPSRQWGSPLVLPSCQYSTLLVGVPLSRPPYKSHHKYCYPQSVLSNGASHKTCPEITTLCPSLPSSHLFHQQGSVCSYSNPDSKACYSVALTHQSQRICSTRHSSTTPVSMYTPLLTPTARLHSHLPNTSHSAPLDSKLSLPSLYSSSTAQVLHPITETPHLAPRHLDPCSPSAGRY